MKCAKIHSRTKWFVHFQKIALGMLAALASTAFAAPPERDATFGNQGVTQISLASESGVGSVVVQPDGKIVVLGTQYGPQTADFYLARYASNGSLDAAFGVSGLVFSSLPAKTYSGSMVLQADGRILITAQRIFGQSSNIMLARFKSDGSPDLSFGETGMVTIDIGGTDDPRGLAVLPDGKILAIGRNETQNVLMRLTSVGELDTSFDGDGKASVGIGSGYLNDIAVRPNGKIVVAGGTATGFTADPAIDFLVMQFNPNGSPDNSFSGDGKATAAVGSFADIGWRVKLQADEEILVAGTIYIDSSGGRSDFAIVRFNADGSLDTTFDLDGKAVTEVGNLGDGLGDIEIQSNGKIVAVGAQAGDGNDYYRPVIVRYLPDGALDASFGSGGLLTEFVGNDAFFNALAIQPDGKLVAVGYNTGQSMVIRYLGDPVAANGSITGRILTADGIPLRRGRISLIDPYDNVRFSSISPFGHYRFDGLLPGMQYTVKLRTKGWSTDTVDVVISGSSATVDLEVVRFP